MAGTTRPGLAARASVARALTTGRIVLDATNWEKPALSVRVELTPLEAAIIRDELDAVLADEAENARAYAYDIATKGYEEVMP